MQIGVLVDGAATNRFGVNAVRVAAGRVQESLLRNKDVGAVVLAVAGAAAATASANGKKGELRRMRDEYAALKRDLADKKSRR